MSFIIVDSFDSVPMFYTFSLFVARETCGTEPGIVWGMLITNTQFKNVHIPYWYCHGVVLVSIIYYCTSVLSVPTLVRARYLSSDESDYNKQPSQYSSSFTRIPFYRNFLDRLQSGPNYYFHESSGTLKLFNVGAKMPKEDRSHWVAVAPEFSREGGGSGSVSIKPAQSAYTFWQKDNTEQVKSEHIASNNGKFEVGLFSRAMRDRWNSLDASEKELYEDMAHRDQFRFRSESHQADVAAIQRRERLQKERSMLLLDDIGGTQRGTRGQRAHKERKEKRKEKRRLKKLKKGRSAEHGDDDDSNDEKYDFRKKGGGGGGDDDDEYIDEQEGSEEEYSDGDDSFDSSDSDSSYHRKKKKPKPVPRKASAKQIENRRRAQEEKQRKEAIIAEQQEDIEKEKAAQAKKRLEFLLKQSSIFSHFGQVKQDQAKFGIKTGTKKKDEEGKESTSRRDHGNANQEEELEEADEHQATFLTAQPTTLGFGKMREYQIEGLNWMIRLQENGVNGILADEVSN